MIYVLIEQFLLELAGEAGQIDSVLVLDMELAAGVKHPLFVGIEGELLVTQTKTLFTHHVVLTVAVYLHYEVGDV